jgi:CheY-like chemotaxis protein/RIO-like serine/threonine protein kinase
VSGDILTSAALDELRHDLRTPINHIVGYAEMVLEDAIEASEGERKAMSEEVLAAAREVLGWINTTLAPSRPEVTRTEVNSLFAAMREPQQRVLRAVNAMLASAGVAPGGPLDEDLRRILKAAEQLVPADSVAAVAPAASGRASAQPATAAARVLVVDDMESYRYVLRRRLERQGYVVDDAAGGYQALELVAQRSYDLVLLDALMPDMDGMAVLEKLKHMPATRDIPVIMISGMDDMPNMVRCIEGGAEDFLPKPFDPVLLKARISASLEKKRLRDTEKEYLRQVAIVIEAATAVEQGAYDSSVLAAVGRRDDELGRLARVFDGMAAHVRAREERLRERVRELREDISVARTTQEIEIVLDGASLKSGSRFAERYEIVAPVGSGGMGTVYRARDLELGDEVAIKTLRPGFVSDSRAVNRFKAEIRLARRITHPNVVRTHDFGEWGGVYYLTMEFVEGITVRELIDAKGSLAAPSALAIGTQLAKSLAAAHEQGVIHRDIKPQNLLLDAAGVLKVMDFGVARLAERTSTLTEAGMLLGTPLYMSPESLLAEKVDGRSDLYAVGVVLYECVTGRVPFEAGSTVSLIAKLLAEEPSPPEAINADVPPALSALILRLLAKKPADRVQTATELAQLLNRLG